MSRLDRIGPPTVMIVRLLPGQVVDDYRMVARRLAEALHVPMIRVRPHGLGYLRIELLHRDPLAEALPLHLPTGHRELLIGRTDDGEVLAEDWAGQAHTIVQGVTRSGKSV